MQMVELLGILVAISWALSTISQKKVLASGVRPGSVVIISAVLFLISTSIWYAFTDPEAFDMRLLTNSLPHFLVIGVIGFALAYIVLMTALASSQAHLVIIYAYLTPVFVLVLSTLLLGEQPRALAALGACLVTLGAVLPQLDKIWNST